MNDKYAKEIARELRLIRKELEKSNKKTLYHLGSNEIEFEKNVELMRNNRMV